MKKALLLSLILVILSGLNLNAQTTISLCGKTGGETIDTACLRQKLIGLKDGTTVDIVSFHIAFFSNKANHSFDMTSDRLSADVIKKILAAPENELTLSFSDVRGMSSTGLSYHTFRGYLILKK